MMSFLLLHGWQNRRPPGHWHHWLAAELAAAGRHVTYPQLPEPDEPVLADWLAALRTHLGELPVGDRTVVCHSLGCLLWLHAAASGQVPLPVDRVLLVAPPGPDVVAGIPEIAGFHPPDVTGGRLDAAALHTRLVCSDNDPYCPAGAAGDYGVPLGIPTTILDGAGHLDMDAGYGPWPSIRDWCLSDSPDTPLTHRD
jgi:predicted alpha/beta hydrolase family esterase